MKIKPFIYSISCLLIFGCNVSLPPESSGLIKSPTSTHSVGVSEPSTSEKIIPAVTGRPEKATSTEQTKEATHQIITNCINIADKRYPIGSYDGIIPMDRRQYNDVKAADYLFDIHNGTKNDLLPNVSHHIQSFLSTSFDHKWLLYEDDIIGVGLVHASDIIVTNSTQSVIYKIQRVSSWIGLPVWLNNNTIAIKSTSDNEENYKIALIHPFNNTINEISTRFPDINKVQPLPSWNYLGPMSINPTLDRAVYVASYNDGDYLNIYNLSDNKIIKKIKFNLSIDRAPGPAWTSDGTKFVIALPIKDSDMHYELFEISKNGEIKQLTRLEENNMGSPTGEYSWSPDGTQIAFWMLHEDDNGAEGLAIEDILNNKTVKYCIKGDYGGPNNGIFPGYSDNPIWSPDGKELIIENRTGPEASRVILIDLDKLVAYQIDNNVKPNGWLIERKN